MVRDGAVDGEVSHREKRVVARHPIELRWVAQSCST